MNTNFSLMQTKPVSAIVRFFYVLFFPLVLLQNCYYNPVVYDLLNPIQEEDQSGLLGILGLVPSSLGITGQLMLNGAAVSGASVRIVNSSEESITDSAGRFNLIGSSGTNNIEVNHNGTIFTIEISVLPPIITIISISNSSYSVFNLEPYDSSVGIPSYLELTSSIPYDGLFVDDGNFFPLLSSGFSFNFSEELEIPSDFDAWRMENFLVSENLGYGSTNITNSSVTIQINNGTYSADTDYTLILMPGIRSVSGKTVKPTYIRFRIGALAL